jgi:hypothetical protein
MDPKKNQHAKWGFLFFFFSFDFIPYFGHLYFFMLTHSKEQDQYAISWGVAFAL